jgi:phage gp29-like protein
MAESSGLLDLFNRPISRADIARLREEVAGPTLAGVRPVFSGHPAEGLTPGKLAAIHRAAALGDSLAYMELAEDIEERDLHYAAVLGTRRRQVTQLPLNVEAAGEDAESQKHAEFIRAWLKRGVLDEALFDLTDAIGKSYSVHEIMWEVTGEGILPVGLPARPQRWFEISREDGHTPLLRETVGLQPLAEHKFLVHRHPSKTGLIVRSGLAKLCSWAWMYKSFTLRDWAIFAQNYGMPIRVGRYGPGSSLEDRTVLRRAVSNIAGDCAAIVPKEMDIEFIEVGNLGTGSDLYEKRADWMDRQVSKAVLGQTTTTDAISGGHAVSQEHRLVQEDIERSDARMLATTVSRELFRRIINFNFPDARNYPTCRIGRPDEIPIAILSDALQKLGPLGLEVEAAELLARLGLKEPAEGSVRVGGRPPPPPPPVPPQDAGKPPGAPPRGALMAGIARQAREDDPDLVETMTRRIAEDAAGALGGLTDQIRAQFDDASDMADLLDRLTGLRLKEGEFTEAMMRGLAIAQLAGQAAVLDELRDG